MKQPETHMDMIKAMSIPNNFIGTSYGEGRGVHFSVGNQEYKNSFVTSPNFLSWTDEDGLSYTTMNDVVIRNYLTDNGITEITNQRRFERECLGGNTGLSFDDVVSNPYSIEGSGMLFRTFYSYLQYCAASDSQQYFEDDSEVVEVSNEEEIEKMFLMFSSSDSAKEAEENVPGYNSETTGLDLYEINKLEMMAIQSETAQDCEQ